MAGRGWRQPWFWVLLQVVAIWGFMALTGQLEPIRHVDSGFYLSLARKASLLEMLGSLRTLPYPLLIRGLRWWLADLAWLPGLQVLAFGAAAVFWSFALRRFGLSVPAALIAGSLPLYSPLFWGLKSSVMTDLPAASLALLTLSSWLMLLRSSGSKLAWWAVGVLFFLTFQMRPSYLFLVVLLPAATWALRALATRWWFSAIPRGGMAWRLAGVVWVPLLLFCCCRWVLVGHFGVVAFAGHNLTGLTASMLSPELVAKLPVSERSLARSILVEREKKGLVPLDALSSPEQWMRDYNWNCWHAGIRLARRDWRLESAAASGNAAGSFRHRDVYVEKKLLSLSLAILRARPGLYVAWLVRGLGHTLVATARNGWILFPAVALGLAWWFAWRRAQGTLALGEERVRMLLVLLLAFSYYLATVGLVLLVEIPGWRYLAAAELLLPGALLAAAVEVAGSDQRAGALAATRMAAT